MFGQADKDDIRGWISEMLDPSTTEQDGACSSIMLMHYAHGNDSRTEIQTVKAGDPKFTVEALSNLFDLLATRYAKGLVGGGAQQFSLHATFGTSPTPTRNLPFQRMGRVDVAAGGISAAGALLTEPPTPTGLTQQSQRWVDIMLHGTMLERQAIIGAMAKMIQDLHLTNRELQKDFGNLFLEYRKLLIDIADKQGEQTIRVIAARRNAQMVNELVRLLPAFIPGMPQTSADFSILQGVQKMFTPEQVEHMASLAAQSDPATQVAFERFISRLQGIQQAGQDDARKLQELARQPLGFDPLDDAGGLGVGDPLVIDPKERLSRVIGGTQVGSEVKRLEEKTSSNGGNGGGHSVAPRPVGAPSEDEALWDSLFGSASPMKIKMMIGVLAGENPELGERLRARFAKFEQTREKSREE
jgi:hypothetical protein